MDKTEDSGTWLKFFKDAGIPTKTGASYAHIFVENRIHKNMLSDLTVDHLRLMGINLIGDIIAILRHAKSVHQESLRKVVILQSKDDRTKTPSVSSSSSSSSSSTNSSSSSSGSDNGVEMVEIVTKPAAKKVLSSAARITDRHLKKEESSSHTENSESKVRSKVISNSNSNNSHPGSEKKIMEQPLKRKYFENEPMNVDEVPVKKTMAKTSTNTNTGRSILKAPDTSAKNILITTDNSFIGPKLPPPKKTVFDRLGAETSSPQVSSTTEVPRPELETKFTRTISNVNLPIEPMKIIANLDSPPPKPNSVFNRLGGLKPDPAESRSGPTLEYVGVLKSSSRVKRPTLNAIHKIGTMRADEPDIPVKLRAAARPTIDKNLKIRVGESALRNRLKTSLTKAGLLKGIMQNPASEGILANPKNEINRTAKERLGLKNDRRKSLSSRPLNQRIRRHTPSPVVVKHGFSDYGDDDYVLSSNLESVRSKKVSFGRVDQKLISPLQSFQGGRNMKSGVHSRLGPRR